MLSSMDYLSNSLELHLFFLRIMKEHSFFLELGFTPRDKDFTEQADFFRREFDDLLAEVVNLSNGVVCNSVLQSGEVITPYTLNAEMASTYYTNVAIATEITQAEAQLMGCNYRDDSSMLEQRVYMINQKAMSLVSRLIQFKAVILSNVLTCRMFTVNYPLLIDHIMREAKLYLQMMRRLQQRADIDIEKEALEQEVFWNRIMAEHSKFIRGLLDPTEKDLIVTAENFGTEFDQLTAKARAVMKQSMPLDQVTDESLKATQEIRDFKEQGTVGLLECKVKSIIIPLLADHTLREANHFLRLLNKYKQ